MADITIDQQTFSKRLKLLYESWKVILAVSTVCDRPVGVGI